MTEAGSREREPAGVAGSPVSAARRWPARGGDPRHHQIAFLLVFLAFVTAFREFTLAPGSTRGRVRRRRSAPRRSPRVPSASRTAGSARRSSRR